MFLSKRYWLLLAAVIEFIYIAMGDKLLNDNGQKRFLFGYLKGFLSSCYYYTTQYMLYGGKKSDKKSLSGEMYAWR